MSILSDIGDAIGGAVKDAERGVGQGIQGLIQGAQTIPTNLAGALEGGVVGQPSPQVQQAMQPHVYPGILGATSPQQQQASAILDQQAQAQGGWPIGNINRASGFNGAIGQDGYATDIMSPPLRGVATALGAAAQHINPNGGQMDPNDPAQIMTHNQHVMDYNSQALQAHQPLMMLQALPQRPRPLG